MNQKKPASTLKLAEDMAYAARHAPTARRRVELAKKALEFSPRCADAYILLAEHSRRGSDQEIEFWWRAVNAGEDVLGAAGFMDFAGEFWAFREARPYMRARFGLACALWTRGGHDNAISHLQDMLELNPSDDQGVRHVLAAYLATLEHNGALGELMARYPDERSAVWAWTGALLAFRQVGKSAAAGKHLDEAMAINPHVRAYLCGDEQMPAKLPSTFIPGTAAEAVRYVASHRRGWERTPASLEWVRTYDSGAKKPVRPSRTSNRKTTPG